MVSIKVEPDDTSAWEEISQRICTPGSHDTPTGGNTGKSLMVKTESASSCLEGRGDTAVKKEESSDPSLEIESDEGTFQVTINIDGDEFPSEEWENGNDLVVKKEDADLTGYSLAPSLQLECHQKKYFVNHPVSLAESSSSENASINTSSPESNAKGDHGMHMNSLPQHLKALTNERSKNYDGNKDSLNEILQTAENEKHCSQISVTELDVEQKVQNPQKLFRCESCEKSFILKSNYDEHQVLHAGVKPLKCQFCGKQFSTVGRYKSHEMIHTGVNPFRCRYCGKSFTSRNRKNLEAHERTHTGEKPFKCQYCEKSFTQVSNRKIHERTHTGERPFKCKVCGKSFIRSGSCKSHERICEKSFKCQYCEKSFTHIHNRKIHERTHTGERPFKCKFCEKQFSSVGRCKSHEITHTGDSPFKCQFCGKPFTDRSYCKAHERTHEKRFKCKFCEKSFAKFASWKSHERAHMGENFFQCKFCGRQFTTVIGRKSHERVHRDPKPHERVHRDSKPLYRVNCQFCKKSFKRKVSYETHVRKHKFEKPFMCKFCGKLYHYELDLKSHERRHTQAREFFIVTTEGSLLPKLQVVNDIPVVNPLNVSFVGSHSPRLVVASHMQGHAQVAYPSKVISVGNLLPS